MARKPDYFEQIVLKPVYYPGEVESLLRRYHAKVRRMVENENGFRLSHSLHCMTQSGKGALWLNRIDILKGLDRLKKGQP